MTETPKAEKPKQSTKTAWKKGAVHEGVTLPSGAVVSIKLPDLPALIKSGHVPNELVDLAIGQETTGRQELSIEQRKELLDKLPEYFAFIVSVTVIDPKLEREDVADLPVEDVDLIVKFAQRQTDMDHVGHQLGGLEVLPDFREFRGLDIGLADLVG